MSKYTDAEVEILGRLQAIETNQKGLFKGQDRLYARIEIDDIEIKKNSVTIAKTETRIKLFIGLFTIIGPIIITFISTLALKYLF